MSVSLGMLLKVMGSKRRSWLVYQFLHLLEIPITKSSFCLHCYGLQWIVLLFCTDLIAVALMHPDFESNLITHIFRKFGVSRTTRSDVIFAFVRGIVGVSCSFEHNACLSVLVFYSLYCVIIINANLQLE